MEASYLSFFSHRLETRKKPVSPSDRGTGSVSASCQSSTYQSSTYQQLKERNRSITAHLTILTFYDKYNIYFTYCHLEKMSTTHLSVKFFPPNIMHIHQGGGHSEYSSGTCLRDLVAHSSRVLAASSLPCRRQSVPRLFRVLFTVGLTQQAESITQNTHYWITSGQDQCPLVMAVKIHEQANGKHRFRHSKEGNLLFLK